MKSSEDFLNEPPPPRAGYRHVQRAQCSGPKRQGQAGPEGRGLLLEPQASLTWLTSGVMQALEPGPQWSGVPGKALGGTPVALFSAAVALCAANAGGGGMSAPNIWGAGQRAEARPGPHFVPCPFGFSSPHRLEVVKGQQSVLNAPHGKGHTYPSHEMEINTVIRKQKLNNAPLPSKP